MPATVDEVLVNRWIFRYLSMNYKVHRSDEITVTEAVSPCLRKPYLYRVRVERPTPVEFLKVVGQEVHRALQDVLRSDGWEVEVGVSLQLDGFVLRGRIDAVKEDAILEFKTVGSLPTDGPYSSHVLQAQAYLAMVGGSRAYLVYLSRNDGKVKVYRAGPNKQALKQVVERAKQLHQALKSGRPPQSTRGPWCEHCSFKLACVSETSKEGVPRPRGRAPW